VTIDEELGWVYFTAHGDRERSYDTHLYRVRLDGTGFAQLTEASGQHRVRFTPSKRFFLDTHSSVDRPGAVELRRADGTLLETLSRANIDSLRELSWIPPEEFVVKATDGKTDLFGVLYKPYDFDPHRKYPVIEYIYDSSYTTVVPRTFTSNNSGVPAQALAQLGFITFIVDGRGTAERGKEFQDVLYGNIGRYEIPDHVAVLKQLAERRPYMDLSRVGIFGGSHGGYMVLRALLAAPDVYHVGVARAPGVDLRDLQADGVEPFMGLLEKNPEAYEYASNLHLAENLTGKLLMIHGTSDKDVPFSQTLKMVEALIEAGKTYDLFLLPGENHRFTATGRRYARDATRRYFEEHLKPEKVVVVSE
jgi:dipeptidyl aminopeptidase/acylaminoacyl peptidase